jgi:putative ABC transport system permease protein
MRSLRGWLVRSAGLFGRGRRDADLAAELESHLQLHIDDNIRAGMMPEAARRDALLTLGGVEATKERYRDQRGIPPLDTLRQDVVYALRMLRKNPGFTATAVITLALGIGANTAIFSMVNAVLLRPLPFPDSERLVQVFETDTARGNRYDVTSYPAYTDWRAQNRSFQSMAAFATRSLTLGLAGESVVVPTKRVSASLFDVLGVEPAIGRRFRDEEQRPGSTTVVILSDGFWRRRFAGSPAVLGQSVLVNDEPHTIVGVMPASFYIERPDEEQIYVPLAIETDRGHGYLRVIARLRPGVSRAQAQADMDRIAARLAEQYPRQHKGVGSNVMSMTDGLAHSARFGLFTMLAVVGVILLIACANVAGLLLARGSTRQHELAVRAALGAGRSRLVRQLLTESVLLAAAGGALGLVGSGWFVRGLAATVATQYRVPRLDAVSTDASVLAFSAVVSLTTGVLFGVLPAFVSASPDLNDALREGGRSATGRRAPRLRNALVVLETALALILLAGAGTLMKTFLTLRATNPGFEPAHVLALDMFLPQPRFAELPARTQYLSAALRRLQGVPGLQAAAFVADLPLGGSTDGQGFHIPGRPDPAEGKAFVSGFNLATAGYFSLMRIPVLAGREFTTSDGPGTAPVIVINETAARRFWPGESPIGHQIDLPTGKSSVRLTVVGVTGDVHHVGLGEPPRAEIFVNSLQAPLPWPWLVLTVRAHGDPTALAESVRAALRETDPNVPVQRIATLEDVVSRSIMEPRLYTFLLGAFAALAVVLAAIGLYGLIAYTVTQRAHELGVRVALGAGRREIIRLVLGQGMRLALVGTAIGLAAAVATTRGLVGLVKGIEPNDPLTFAAVTAVLLGAALVAAYLPARRAARVDPMIALRAE